MSHDARANISSVTDSFDNANLAALARFENTIREFTAREFEALRLRYTARSLEELVGAIDHVNEICADGVAAELQTPTRSGEFEAGARSLATGATAERTLFQIKLHRPTDRGLTGQAYLSHHSHVDWVPNAYASMAFLTDVDGSPRVVAWYDLAPDDLESVDFVYLDLRWKHSWGRSIHVNPPALLVRKFVEPAFDAHRVEFKSE